MNYLGGDLHLFTDDNPETTLKGLGFKTLDKTKNSIVLIEKTFSNLRDKQEIGGCSPNNLRPKVFLETSKHIDKFYLQQKMYRILGLLNRAKIIYKRYPSDELKKSIELLEEWMADYHISIKKYNDIKLKKCAFK